MIDINFNSIQITPNPAFAGETFIIRVDVKGKALRWSDVKNRTWNDLKDKTWD